MSGMGSAASVCTVINRSKSYGNGSVRFLLGMNYTSPDSHRETRVGAASSTKATSRQGEKPCQ